jgi:Zn-dependent peptidase ImmA (M78 family)
MSGRILPDPEKLSARVLRMAGVAKAPVNLQRIVSAWADLRVIEEELDGSGYLLPLGRLGAEIIVNRADTLERRRFTIAHELGHWVLGVIWKKKSGEFRQPPGVPRTELERWCDLFAASLLMPRTFLEGWLMDRHRPTFIDSIFRARDKFEVSDEALFIRLWELSHIRVVVLGKTASNGCVAQFAIERDYGDENGQPVASELVSLPAVQTQLQMVSPLLFFSGTRLGVPFECSGRRVSREKIIMAIDWPWVSGSSAAMNGRAV